MKHKITSENFILKIPLQRNLRSVAKEKKEVMLVGLDMAKGNTYLQKVNKLFCFMGVGILLFFVVLGERTCSGVYLTWN